MAVGEHSGLRESCARCAEDAVAMCTDCGDLLCPRHVETSATPGPWAFRARAGSELATCTPCNRARMWRWLRGAGALAAITTAIVLWLEDAPAAALGAVGAAVAWWLLATGIGRLAAAAARGKQRRS